MTKHRFWRIGKWLVSMILVFSLVLNTLSFVDAEQFSESEPQRQVEDIIDPELLHAIECSDENELFTIIVWMGLIPEAEINEFLVNETGLDSDIYENAECFNELVLPNIEQRICKKYNRSNPPQSDDACYQEFKQELDAAIVEEYDNYWREKHIITKREHTLLTNSFINNVVNNPQRNILYQGQYTSTICLEATADEIFTYADYPFVEEISQYTEHEMSSCLDVSADQIGVYSSGGTGIEDFEGDPVYDGLGVRIGIIEFSGKYEANSPHLSQLSNLHYIQNAYLTPDENAHATMVTSIIVGKSITINNRTYKGIVPNATVYQTYAENEWGTCNALSLLVESYNVSVINCSAGDYIDECYDDFDKEIDRLITKTGVTFVCAAGNTTGAVLSPGKGYNVITVGNAITKTSTGNSLQTPYCINPTSSYVTDSVIPNKPDICAPGTHIEVGSSIGIQIDSGTSYSAPLVTGVIAQMLQANQALIGHPTEIKAILLASADQSKISTYNNPLDNYNFREKSGAGFINAVKAVENAKQYNCLSFISNSNQTVLPPIYCHAGDVLRVAMVFDKKHEDLIWSHLPESDNHINDYDLVLQGLNSGLCALSCSAKNNVEIIEYTVTSDDVFFVIAELFNLAYPNDPSLFPIVSVAFSIN